MGAGSNTDPFVKAMTSGDTTINVPRGVPKQNGPYRLDFYADVNRSGGFDRGTKIPLYALCGISEAWLVDLAAEVLEVYREPARF